jgi:NTE family protein
MESSSRIVRLLGGVPAFAGLDSPQLNRLVSATALKAVAKGDPATVAGALQDELCIVLSGRVAELGEGPDAKEFGQGAALEADAFFTRAEASATLHALRDTMLLILGWEDLAAAFYADPHLLASVFVSLKRHSGVFRDAASKPARLAVCPAGAKGRLDDGVKTALLGALEDIVEVRILRRDSFGSLALDAPDAAHWLQEQELEFDLTVIFADPSDPDFAMTAIEEADEILFVADGGAPSLSALEQHALERRGKERCRLVVPKGKKISERSADDWLAARPYRATQFSDLESPDAPALIAASLAGRGNAIAAASRGVHAAAILGALQAFEAAGAPPVCLAAAGSAILPAGLLACGASLADTEAVFRELATAKSWKLAAKPEAGLFEAATTDTALSLALPSFDIGLAARPFAAVSFSLSRNAPLRHKKGRLQDAMRAGLAPPGVLPAFIDDDGDILVSGDRQIEALIEAAGALSPSPLVLLYADAPPLGASKMSYRQLSGASFWMTAFAPSTPEKRLRLEAALGAPGGENPALVAERLGAICLAIPILDGVYPMDWPEWVALRDAAFDWTSAEIESRALALAWLGRS